MSLEAVKAIVLDGIERALAEHWAEVSQQDSDEIRRCHILVDLAAILKSSVDFTTGFLETKLKRAQTALRDNQGTLTLPGAGNSELNKLEQIQTYLHKLVIQGTFGAEPFTRLYPEFFTSPFYDQIERLVVSEAEREEIVTVKGSMFSAVRAHSFEAMLRELAREIHQDARFPQPFLFNFPKNPTDRFGLLSISLAEHEGTLDTLFSELVRVARLQPTQPLAEAAAEPVFEDRNPTPLSRRGGMRKKRAEFLTLFKEDLADYLKQGENPSNFSRSSAYFLSDSEKPEFEDPNKAKELLTGVKTAIATAIANTDITQNENASRVNLAVRLLMRLIRVGYSKAFDLGITDTFMVNDTLNDYGIDLLLFDVLADPTMRETAIIKAALTIFEKANIALADYRRILRNMFVVSGLPIREPKDKAIGCLLGSLIQLANRAQTVIGQTKKSTPQQNQAFFILTRFLLILAANETEDKTFQKKLIKAAHAYGFLAEYHQGISTRTLTVPNPTVGLAEYGVVVSNCFSDDVTQDISDKGSLTSCHAVLLYYLANELVAMRESTAAIDATADTQDQRAFYPLVTQLESASAITFASRLYDEAQTIADGGAFKHRLKKLGFFANPEGQRTVASTLDEKRPAWNIRLWRAFPTMS